MVTDEKRIFWTSMNWRCRILFYSSLTCAIWHVWVYDVFPMLKDDKYVVLLFPGSASTLLTIWLWVKHGILFVIKKRSTRSSPRQQLGNGNYQKLDQKAAQLLLANKDMSMCKRGAGLWKS